MNAGKLFVFMLCLTVVVALMSDRFSLSVDDMRADKKAEIEKTPLYQLSQGKMPGVQKQQQGYGDEIRLARGQGGHYWAEGEVDGAAVTFVVDTGASYISLSYEDAERAGLDPENLDYDGRVNTANGVARIAHVTLSSFRIGAIEVYDVKAIISSPGALPVSLLGMSFLNRLNSFRVEGSDLVLRY